MPWILGCVANKARKVKKMAQPILEVKNLEVGFHTYRGTVQAIRRVSFALKEGEILGVVGESACGKSVTVNAVMGILPQENSFISQGEIFYRGNNLLTYSEKQMEELRGYKISMIFQDPMTSLNPVLKIGTQLIEGYLRHKRAGKQEARAKALELLRAVGIPNPEKRMKEYPHQFSGGMRQRVVIAMALICEPEILIADEPTTALDVTIQAQILELLKQSRQDFHTSIILISHDLGIIADMCDRVAVMYAGQLVEQGLVEDIFYRPLHPYTKGLLASLPRLNADKGQGLKVIKGQPPDLLKIPEGCAFAPRCSAAMKGCLDKAPEEYRAKEEHLVFCHLYRQKMEEVRI